MAVAPLSLPGYAAPQTLDFSSLANLGQVYKQAQADATRRDTLAQLGQGDKIDPRVLLASGDLSLANLGVQIQNRQQDQERQARLDQRQTGRDAVDDRFREESLRLQKAAAARANEDKPIIKEVTDPNTGATSFVRINPRTGELSPLGNPQPASQPNNPFSAGGKFNEGQGKAAGFTDRMLQSEGILSGLNGEGGVQNEGTGYIVPQIARVPGIGNAIVGKVSPDYQKYAQAKRDFVNAQLRRESGAAISPSEFESAEKQYFPTPGDSQEVIAQKAANRRAAVEAMGREGGPSYKPKYSFDEGGRVVPYGQPKAQQQTAPVMPKTGELRDGYRYKGGNPADPNSWVKQQ